MCYWAGEESKEFCCEDLKILSIIFTEDKILILCIKHLRERETLFNFIEVSRENEITENSVVYDKTLP